MYLYMFGCWVGTPVGRLQESEDKVGSNCGTGATTSVWMERVVSIKGGGGVS